LLLSATIHDSDSRDALQHEIPPAAALGEWAAAQAIATPQSGDSRPGAVRRAKPDFTAAELLLFIRAKWKTYESRFPDKH